MRPVEDRLKMRYLRFCKISVEEVRVTMTGENYRLVFRFHVLILFSSRAAPDIKCRPYMNERKVALLSEAEGDRIAVHPSI